MIFLRYESIKEYRQRYPATTILLILYGVIHVAFEGWAWYADVSPDFLKQQWGAFVQSSEAMVTPAYWQFFTANFLHHDWMHLLLNAFSLYVFAPPLERWLRAWRYVGLIVFSGIIGNVFTALFFTEVYSLGASGSVYGVLGAYVYILLFHRTMVDDASRKTVWVMLAIGAIYSIVVSNINVYAHLGGLLGGFVYIALYVMLNRKRA